MKPSALFSIITITLLVLSQPATSQSQQGTLLPPITFVPELKLTQKDFPSNSGQVSVTDIKVDSKGNLRFLDSKSNRIWAFSPAGKFLSVFNILDDKKNGPSYPSALLIDSHDNLYVLDAQSFNNKSVLVFDSQGTFLWRFSVQLVSPRPEHFTGVMTPTDQLILAGYLNDKIIHIFDTKGNLIRSLGERVTREQVRSGEASTQAMLYENGFLYYTLLTRYELRKLDVANDKYIATSTPPGFHWGQFTVFLALFKTPESNIIAFRRTDNAEIADAFSKEGTFVGSMPSTFAAMTSDRQGKVWCLVYGMPTTVMRCQLKSTRR